jgi:hypothetical protein
MTLDEITEYAQEYEERRQRRNAHQRERRRRLKTAPREETVLKYRAQEKPCSIAQYLQAERSLLGKMEDYPDLAGSATDILLVLSHNILHLLHPEIRCPGTTFADCSFSLHELCAAAIEIGLNYRLDPAFKVSNDQVFRAMMELSSGVNRERLHFNALLSDISIDL